MSVISMKKKDRKGAETALVPASSTRKGEHGAPVAMSASPRARLLPPEVGAARRKRSVRNRAWAGVVVVLLIVLAASGGSFFYAGSATAKLLAAQAESQTLNAKLAGFGDVKAAQGRIATLTAAQAVGGAADVDWASYIAQLKANLPAGVSLANVTITSAGISDALVSTDVASTVAPTATIAFSAKSAKLPVLPDWIDGLSKLPGYITAVPRSVSSEDSGYTATVEMVIGPDALSHRYLAKPKGASK
ncbi:MAG: hypothetical protein HY996_12565 [Micrococcales bacterium]|nr:hypothetical protein [Micrococcales bacterium]